MTHSVVKRFRTWIVCVVGALAMGCRGKPPAGSGPTVDAVEAMPPAPVSHFDVPLRYDFSVMLDKVEHVVPTTFGSLDSVQQVGDDSRKHYAYQVSRGKFTAFAEGSLVHLRTTLTYKARGFYKPVIGPTISAGCGFGDQHPQIVIELVTPLTLTPEWHLKSKARLLELEPATTEATDHCKVSVLRVDVTDRIVGAARDAITSHLADIDRTIQNIDLTGNATGWWQSLNRPIHLADGVWLMLQPRLLRVGTTTGNGHVLTVRAGLDASPTIVTGAEPHPEIPPLPALAKTTTATGFDILLDGNVDYFAASRAVSDALRGQTVTENGHSVTVKSVVVVPEASGRLALTVTFVGDAGGTLRLVGTPRLDRARTHIVVPDLEFDLTTDSHILGAYAWSHSDDLRDMLRGKATLEVQPILDRGRQLLLSGLNRTIGDVMKLSATVDSVHALGLYITPAGIVVRAGASGNAQVSVHQTH